MMNRKEYGLLFESWRRFLNENVEDEIPELPKNSVDEKGKDRAEKIMTHIESLYTGAIEKPSEYYEDKASVINSFDCVHDLRFNAKRIDLKSLYSILNKLKLILKNKFKAREATKYRDIFIFNRYNNFEVRSLKTNQKTGFFCVKTLEDEDISRLKEKFVEEFLEEFDEGLYNDEVAAIDEAIKFLKDGYYSKNALKESDEDFLKKLKKLFLFMNQEEFLENHGNQLLLQLGKEIDVVKIINEIDKLFPYDHYDNYLDKESEFSELDNQEEIIKSQEAFITHVKKIFGNEATKFLGDITSYLNKENISAFYDKKYEDFYDDNKHLFNENNTNFVVQFQFDQTCDTPKISHGDAVELLKGRKRRLLATGQEVDHPDSNWSLMINFVCKKNDPIVESIINELISG